MVEKRVLESEVEWASGTAKHRVRTGHFPPRKQNLTLFSGWKKAEMIEKLKEEQGRED